MRRYETIIIIDPDLSEAPRIELLEKAKKIINDYKGEIIQVDEWGNRKLAYEIRKKTRGYYILIDFCGNGDLVGELERTFRLDDKYMKYLTIIIDDNVDPEAIRAEIANKKAEESKAAEEAAASEETSEETEKAPAEEATEEATTKETADPSSEEE